MRFRGCCALSFIFILSSTKPWVASAGCDSAVGRICRMRLYRGSHLPDATLHSSNILSYLVTLGKSDPRAGVTLGKSDSRGWSDSLLAVFVLAEMLRKSCFDRIVLDVSDNLFVLFVTSRPMIKPLGLPKPFCGQI